MSSLKKIIISTFIGLLTLNAYADSDNKKNEIQRLLMDARENILSVSSDNHPEKCLSHLRDSNYQTLQSIKDIYSQNYDQAIVDIGKANYELITLSSEGEPCHKAFNDTEGARYLFERSLITIIDEFKR